MSGPMSFTVAHQGEVHQGAEGARLTFGRGEECTIRLAPDDHGISREAGSIEARDGQVWLVNRSRTRSLRVRDERGLPNTVPPGRRYAVDVPITVIVEGSSGRHALAIDVPPAPRPVAAGPAGGGLPTATGEDVTITSDDRRALTALFAGYLEPPPRYSPIPRSYKAAGVRLGWPESTVRKRIEYLRRRLTQAGVPNLDGPDALKNLAEHAIATGLISTEHLDEDLRRPR